MLVNSSQVKNLTCDPPRRESNLMLANLMSLNSSQVKNSMCNPPAQEIEFNVS